MTANARAQELLERDIGKMVVRIDSLIALAEELEKENEGLKKRITELEGALHGS